MYIDLPTFDRAAAAEEILGAARDIGSNFSPHTLGIYKPRCGEALLVAMRLPVQRRIARQIYPCNSFGRVALRGAELLEHTDRPGLHWTVSIMVEADAPWPIKVLSRNEWHSFEKWDRGVLIESGKLPHRREPYAGARAVQLFLHYTEDAGREGDA